MSEDIVKAVTDVFTENGSDIEAIYYQDFRLRHIHEAAEAEHKILSILADSGMNMTEAKGCLKFVALRLGLRAYIKIDD